MTRIEEITCKSACNRLKRDFPYPWDLNLYRGCAHGCRYCYAMYAHHYLGDEGSYFDTVYVKTNILEHLERELHSAGWKRELVNIGGVTDSYQPAEARYCLMPEVLRLMKRYRTPCVISTKSDLILRDFDLIAALAEETYVNVAVTVTTLDETIAARLEPGAATVKERLGVLRAFRGTRAGLGFHAMPLVPLLTDDIEPIRALFEAAKDCGAHYVLAASLGLRGRTRAVFFDFIAQAYPRLVQPLLDLYRKGRLDPAYLRAFRERVRAAREEAGMFGSYEALLNERLRRDVQLSLFDAP